STRNEARRLIACAVPPTIGGPSTKPEYVSVVMVAIARPGFALPRPAVLKSRGAVIEIPAPPTANPASATGAFGAAAAIVRPNARPRFACRRKRVAAERERNSEQEDRDDGEHAFGFYACAACETGGDRADEHAHGVPGMSEREQT